MTFGMDTEQAQQQNRGGLGDVQTQQENVQQMRQQLISNMEGNSGAALDAALQHFDELAANAVQQNVKTEEETEAAGVAIQTIYQTDQEQASSNAGGSGK